MEKTCKKCGKIKPATSEFYYKSKNGKLGFKSTCKLCCNEYFNGYDKENKEKRNKKSLEYYHKTKVLKGRKPLKPKKDKTETKPATFYSYDNAY